MLNHFFQNTRKPQGFFGRLMLRSMSSGHAKMAAWGFSHLDNRGYPHVLDVGCGGGANIEKMLHDYPASVVDGLDYAEESVAFSKKRNASQLGKRCTIQQGDVAKLPYADETLDLVTAFETIYFWPSLSEAFVEIKRVLKPGGTFFICCEFDDADYTTWTDRIEGMKIYRGEDLKKLLLDCGFQSVQVDRNQKGWVCLTAIC